MPPRPARQSTRYASREPEETTGGPQISLVKPKLPALKGTPSSRRQYTYGSAVEPPPRLGAGFQQMTLKNAVSQALKKRPDEEEEFVQPPKPAPKPAQKPAAAKADRGKTSKDNAARQATTTTTTATGHLAVGRDDDSSRSFGLESEYYDHATIEPAPSRPPVVTAKQQPAPKTSLGPEEEESSDDDSLPSPIEEEPRSSVRLIENFDEVDARQTRSHSSRSRSQRGSTRPTENLEAPKEVANTARQSSSQPSRSRGQQKTSTRPTENLETQNDALVATRQNDSQPSRSRDQQKSSTHLNERHTQKASESSIWATQKPLPGTGTESETRIGATLNNRRPNGKKSLFGPATTGSDALKRAQQLPSDPRQRDWDIQREISAAEAEDTRIREMVERMERSRLYYEWVRFTGWLKFLFWPPYWFRRGDQDPFDFNFEDTVQNSDNAPTEWTRLFSPMTYLRVLRRWFDKTMDRVFAFVDGLSGIQVGQVHRSFAVRLVWAVALAGIAFFLLFTSGALRYVPDFPDFPDIGSLKPTVDWPNTEEFSVGKMVPSVSWPSLPSLPSWPSWGRDDDDFSFPDPFPRDDAVIPDDYKKALDALKDQAKIQKKALKRLEKILPQIVHMDLVKGRPSIKPEFWHALQDHLKESGSFLNLEKKSGNFEISSEKQWKAIVARLGKDNNFQGKLDGIVGNSIQDKLPNFWDTWFKKNNDVLEPLVEKAMAKRQSAGSGAAFDQQLAKIVGEELRKQNQTAVSRDEFMAYVKNDLMEHKSEVEAEFNRLKSYMSDYIMDTVRTAKMMAPRTMTDTEMRKLVRKVVYQTLTDGSLEAAAKSKIHAHWNSNLKYQVNFFGIGAGATIETKFTAPVWDPYKDKAQVKKALALGLRGARPLPAIHALSAWQEEGERWCGSHTEDTDGRSHGVGLSVHLGHEVVPENIVVEHIHPNATMDPSARPRHIEVFARFEVKEEQELVRDYSSNKFPDHINGWDFNPSPLPDSFVKITQFEYQGDELNEGVHVHHINDEFANLRIPTDHVIIRALSNYGAPDHTCFYRVRLFGNQVDEQA
ncbi:hypothetical protein FPOAC2_07878 [Fusarium poae]|uniref:hypothetical protein n=1 Tax=Fusarium poae TaxID=36050 RepID=UPI001CE85D20|nr:hypothetical protein FPOAC1_007962 [Fusarium poae]KAG8668579.1 hypothetical protein FPOAC1_007962 [Fusarium poae]